MAAARRVPAGRFLLLLAQEHLEFRLPVSAPRPGMGRDGTGGGREGGAALGGSPRGQPGTARGQAACPGPSPGPFLFPQGLQGDAGALGGEGALQARRCPSPGTAVPSELPSTSAPSPGTACLRHGSPGTCRACPRRPCFLRLAACL